MKTLLNTLYVQTQGAYLRLDHDTVTMEAPDEDARSIPLHHVGSICVFGNVLVSPYLIHRLAEDQRSLVWFSTYGRFRARLEGPTSGNVHLRVQQHGMAQSTEETLGLARSFVDGKLRNMRSVLLKSRRDGVRDEEAVERSIRSLEDQRDRVHDVRSLDALRGVEGVATSMYFGAFDAMITSDDARMRFVGRSRRPPRDRINALLSFTYSLLANDCASALEGVGLDPQVGFLHALRPGRPALALDLMEEFRSTIADRHVLSLVNLGRITAEDFRETPGGAVLLNDDGRTKFLTAWQERKQTELTHPLLDQRTNVGLLPHLQARLLARHVRGDLPRYDPYAIR